MVYCGHTIVINERLFVGGVGIPAMGLREVAYLFGGSVNVPKVAVFLTDGEQPVQEECANNKTEQLKSDGVEMYAVGELMGST